MRGGIKLVKRCRPKVIRSIRFYKDRDPENYCREQLMLYTPWRKESTDLLANCESYAERFEQLNHVILRNNQQYECHNKILQKAIDDFNTIMGKTVHKNKNKNQVNCLAVLIQETIRFIASMTWLMTLVYFLDAIP